MRKRSKREGEGGGRKGGGGREGESERRGRREGREGDVVEYEC